MSELEIKSSNSEILYDFEEVSKNLESEEIKTETKNYNLKKELQENVRKYKEKHSIQGRLKILCRENSKIGKDKITVYCIKNLDFVYKDELIKALLIQQVKSEIIFDYEDIKEILTFCNQNNLKNSEKEISIKLHPSYAGIVTIQAKGISISWK